MSRLAQLLAERRVHPSRSVVLVPYAQLMQQARQAWANHVASSGAAASFTPRFETTMNWAKALSASRGGFEPTGDDIRFDAAFDVLTAAALLRRAGLASHQDVLAGRLVEAATALARQAAAVAPPERAGWGMRLAAEWAASRDAADGGLQSHGGRIEGSRPLGGQTHAPARALRRRDGSGLPG
ncbi:MAG: hypothetical protein EOO54_26630, partial [Haliea sp.]